MPSRSAAAVAAILGALAVAGSAAWMGRELWQLAAEGGRLPRWDMAKYGVSSLRLADAVRAWDPLAWIGQVYELSTWPPVFPLFESLVFLAWDDDPISARRSIVVLWGLAAVAAFFAGYVAAGGTAGTGGARSTLPRPLAGLLAGMLTAAAVLSGPFFQVLATLHMLEIPGLLLLAVCGITTCRALEEPGSYRRWRRAWIAAAVLFFCKYNYGLPWIAALLLERAVSRAGSWRALSTRLRRWVAARRPLRSPWVRALAALALLAVVLRLTGPLRFEIWGQTVQLGSAGTPAYVLYLLWLVRLARRELRARSAAHPDEGLERRLAALPAWGRAGSIWLALPVGVWMALPPHLADFLAFVGNRSSGLSPWRLELWTFYPDVLASLFAPHPIAALAAAVLASAFVRHAVGVEPRRRLLALALLLHAGAVLVHPYKLPRFASSLAFLAALAASLSLVELLGRIGRGPVAVDPPPQTPRPGIRSSVAAVLAVLVSAAAWAAVATVGVHDDFVRREHRLRTVEASTARVLDLLSDPELRRDGLLVLGMWDGLSPALLEWHVRRRDRAAAAHDAEPPPSPASGIEAYRRDPRRLLRRLTAADPSDSAASVPAYGRLAALTLEPAAGAAPATDTSTAGGGDLRSVQWRRIFESDTAWLAPVSAAFRRGELPYVEEGIHAFPESSYRVVVLRRIEAPDVAGGAVRRE